MRFQFYVAALMRDGICDYQTIKLEFKKKKILGGNECGHMLGGCPCTCTQAYFELNDEPILSKDHPPPPFNILGNLLIRILVEMIQFSVR